MFKREIRKKGNVEKYNALKQIREEACDTCNYVVKAKVNPFNEKWHFECPKCGEIWDTKYLQEQTEKENPFKIKSML